MNGFERHGIKHTSPSSINLYASAPDVFIAEKLYGLRGKMSAAALRGTVIEDAVVNVIAYGVTEEDAVKEAKAKFHKETMFSGADKIESEREMIAPCVSLALEQLNPYGEPEFKQIGQQNKIELLCKGDGWELPVIGFLDLVFPKHGLVIDLKTTSRMPSVMPTNHLRQCAIYSRAEGNKEVKFLYITPKKAQFHQCDDVPATLAEVKAILNRQEKFLNLGDKELLKDIVHFDPESFYWNGNEAARKEVFGR